MLHETESLIKTTQTAPDGYFSFDLYDVIYSIVYNRFLIIRYNGTNGQGGATAVIGIIPGFTYNPFIHIIESIALLGLFPLFHQISIITVSCLTIITTVLSRKMKRTTRRIVSH